MSEYVDFKIIITSKDQDTYSVRVDRYGEIAEATGEFKTSLLTNQIQPAPDSPQMTERKMTIISKVGGAETTFDYSATLDEGTANDFGKKLSDAVFSGNIAVRLGEFREYCRSQGASLRIRIDLTGAPKLAALPWEYLRTTDNGNFVCLEDNITLVRYLQADVVPKPHEISYNLKILVVASTPANWAALNKDAEIKNITDKVMALTSPVSKIRVEVLTGGAFSENIERKLEEAKDDNDPFHVLHFIGHGKFNEETGKGELLFENELREGIPYNDEKLATLLQPYKDLRLVVLNSCEGARGSAADSYSSMAAKIIRTARIPAIIAMQFSITDNAAIIFSKTFYGTLARGETIEEAIYEARKEIREKYDAEWATPVLYLTADDGRLFNLKIPKVDTGLINHYATLKSELKECKCVIFLGLDVNLLNRSLREPWDIRYGFPGTMELCSTLNNMLTPNPQIKSLAGIATQIEVLNFTNLNDDFRQLFDNAQANPSKLYEVLAGITKNITDNLPGEAEDRSRSGLLFVTTTFDSNLEIAFKNSGIDDFHIVYYDGDGNGPPKFSHIRFMAGKPGPKIPITKTIAQKSEGFKDKYPVILKLQGQIQPNSPLVFREDDFFSFAGKEPIQVIPALLKTQIEENRHLYLGYNLQDWSLRMLWNWLCKGRAPQIKKSSWAIIGQNDPNQHFWHSAGVLYRPVDFDDYVKGLDELVWDKPKTESKNG